MSWLDLFIFFLISHLANSEMTEMKMRGLKVTVNQLVLSVYFLLHYHSFMSQLLKHKYRIYKAQDHSATDTSPVSYAIIPENLPFYL